jgi:hypothetical protein
MNVSVKIKKKKVWVKQVENLKLKPEVERISFFVKKY